MIIRNVGFTGTRNSPTPAQRKNIEKFIDRLVTLAGASQLKAHSGDCVGADALFHDIVTFYGLYTVGHIPIKDEVRAFRTYDEENAPLNYFGRNRTIVASSDILLGCPWQNIEQDSGGTWYTINFARKRNKPTIIFWPDGRVSIENFPERYNGTFDD